MIKYRYCKAAGVSLVMHALLFGIVSFGCGMYTPPAIIAPVAVEILPADMTEPGQQPNDSAASMPAVLQPPAAAEQQNQTERTAERSVTAFLPETGWHTGVSESATLPVNAPAKAAPGDGAAFESVAINTASAGSPAPYTPQRSQPAFLAGRRPDYPQQARRAGQEGTVVIRVLVSTDGSAAETAVLVSSGYSLLDEAAVRGVKKWRFSPARYGSVPVESYHDIRVRFRLADAE